MTIINIDVPGITAATFGPYDVTFYLAWQEDLASVAAGSQIEPVMVGYKVFFIEVNS